MRRIVNPLAVALLLSAGSAILPAADEADGNSGIHAPVTSREIDQLKNQISDAARSSIEGIAEYHTETGDLNNRLDFWRGGGRINYRHSSGTLFYLRGTQTSYRTTGNVLNQWGLNLTAGLKTSLSESASLQLEAGATRFSTDASTVNAMGSLEFRTSERSSVYINGSRTNVEESLLSASGIRATAGPFSGKLVGLVMDNRGILGARYRLTDRLDVFAQGGAGVREGRNVESNFLKSAAAGVGYNLIAEAEDNPLSLVRASYGLDYFGFEKNLLGFGGASLIGAQGRPVPLSQIGRDGISPVAAGGHAGVGGYFSPEQYVSNVGRLEVQGRLHPRLDYLASGFAGSQDYTGSKIRMAHGATGTITVRLSDRFSLPVTYLWDNFGPFTQQSVFFRLVARL